MKTTFLTLLLTCLGLWAQTPDTAAPPASTPATIVGTNAAGPNKTNSLNASRERLQEAQRRRAASLTNAPAGPAAPAPAAGSVVPSTNRSSIAIPSSGGTSSGIALPSNPTNIVVAVPTGAAPEETVPPGMIDFRGADIKEVLQLYAELVNRTVLRVATLPAQPIILRTQTDLTKREAIQALDAVLALNGITMVNMGEKFVKAVPVGEANTTGAEFSKLTADQLPSLGQYVTHVVQLKYVKPGELVQALQPFAKIPNAILPIEGSQMLVLRDFTENIKRMLELIKEVDVNVPSEYENEVIPIKYALASEIASALNSLSTGGGGTTVGGGGGTAGGARTGGGSFGRSTGAGGMGGMGGVGGMGRSGYGQSGMSPMAGGATPGAPGAGGTFTERLNRIITKASASGEITILGENKIIADERTNSLLIFASKADMKRIKDIVAKLDVVLAQVLIEAVIIEVNLGDDQTLGVSYLEGKAHGVGNFNGRGAINNFNIPEPASFGSGTNSLPGGFSYLSTFGDDLTVFLKAVANDNRARVLQRPRIQTSHAVQAQLFVGQSRPYPTASYYGGGGYGGYSSIQQLQIGVTLDVTPLINPDGLVVMDIHQTIESYNGDVQIANVGAVPITSRKEAAAKVAVRDRDTIILGGLIEDDDSRSASGVPYLKDIPLLGALFRTSTSKKSRSELIVLIRPTVLPTPEVAALAASAEKDKMPAVRRADVDIREEEAKRLKKSEKYKYDNKDY